MSSSPSQSDTLLLPSSDVESQLSSVVYELSQQVQSALENMLKMTNEIDQSSGEITQEIDNCKTYALERKQNLEEEKERFQKAAYTVLDLLNNNKEIS